jgi:hypothetical protein
MSVWAYLRRIVDRWLGRYRPERHYMRGPGPKWFAAHGRVPVPVRRRVRR